MGADDLSSPGAQKPNHHHHCRVIPVPVRLATPDAASAAARLPAVARRGAAGNPGETALGPGQGVVPRLLALRGARLPVPTPAGRHRYRRRYGRYGRYRRRGRYGAEAEAAAGVGVDAADRGAPAGYSDGAPSAQHGAPHPRRKVSGEVLMAGGKTRMLIIFPTKDLWSVKLENA